MTVAGTADRGSGNLPGILFFLSAIFCFGLMDTGIKWLSGTYDTWQIIAFRAAFSLIPIAVLVAMSGGASALRTARPLAHVLRSIVGLAAVFCFFYAFAHMPLADVYAISFAAPLFITALSVPILKERVGWRRWAAVLVGFAGVMVMLRPGTGVFSAIALVPLLGALLYGLLMIYIRILSRTETNAAIVFYFMVTTAVVAAMMSVPVWATPNAADFALLAAVGIIGGVAQILFTQAFRLASPTLLAPFEYSGMLWAVTFGYLVFGDVPDPFIWAGGAIVIASGLYILHRETVQSRIPQ